MSNIAFAFRYPCGNVVTAYLTLARELRSGQHFGRTSRADRRDNDGIQAAFSAAIGSTNAAGQTPE